MKILASHDGHDPNITILDDKAIVHFEEERFSRIKHKGNNESKKFIREIISDFKPELTVNVISNHSNETVYTKFSEQLISKNNIINISHHFAHAAYAYYTRPKNIEDCDIFVLDGWGMETDRYFYDKTLTLIDTTPFGIGLLWELSSLRGWGHMFMEGRIMGMSAYGTFHEEVNDLYTKALEILQRTINIPEDERKYKKEEYIIEAKGVLVDMYYKHTAEDIAKTLQVFSENIIFDYLKKMKTSDSLLISGGVGLNGYINTKLRKLYKNVYVPPACSDTGLSVGAALSVQKKRIENPAYLGWIYSYNDFLKENNFLIFDDTTIINKIVDKIIEGKVVAIHNGRSESGPRALGNRSILCDPRSGIVKKFLNKLKDREWYRPFAPVVLEDQVEDWFEGNIENSPYMLDIVKFKNNREELCPAVSHVDNTGRIQTVSKNTNNRLYELVNTFYKRTGVPILLNTSFNFHEPIVETPEDALRTFNKIGIDVLFVGNGMKEKEQGLFLV